MTRRGLLAGALGLGAAAVAATSGCRLISAGPRRFDDITVGAIGIFPSPGEKFEGELPETALKAALGKLNSEGGALGRRVVFRGAQAGTEDEAFEGYRRLESDPTVIGVILATPLASERIVAAAASAGLPVISTVTDLEGSGLMWPAASANRSIFQFQIPELWSLEVAAAYCSNDRRYRSAALLFDDFLFPNAGRAFVSACAVQGLAVAAVEQFGQEGLSLSEQLARLATTACPALFVWGDPQTTGDVASELRALGASYGSSDLARTTGPGNWHPQLIGCPTGMFERDWAEVAGDSAVPGSVTPGDFGAFRKGPVWLPEKWGEEYGLDWDRKTDKRRGIRSIVDSSFALVESVRRVGSTTRSDAVRGLETGRDFRFASTRFGFSDRSHVALTNDDVALFTLERSTAVPTTPAYSLGREWDLKIMDDPDMTLLVRPRFAANEMLHAENVTALVEGGFGTQCARGPDGALSASCRIH